MNRKDFYAGKDRDVARFVLPKKLIKRIRRFAFDEDVRASIVAERLLRNGIEYERRRQQETEPETASA